ncbi:MAG TPA: fasciclin domain-containing protein, partial [Acidimicrobiia bacterium]|nr:fasciclin domain-containing protein [Acidimicrobiia bacterium]
MFSRLIAGVVTASMAVIGSAGIAAAASPVVPPSRADADIVSIAVADGRFTTLVAAVGCADPAVGAALTSGQQLTVFAPTDGAFAALGLSAANVCTALDQATLTDVLLYHVTEGRRFSNSVLPKRDGQQRTISTLLGASFGVDR